MKFRRDMDEWYPSIDHAVAVHVMGPEVFAGGMYSVVLEDKRSDERLIDACYKTAKEAKVGYALAAVRCDFIIGEMRISAHHELRTSVESFFRRGGR